MAVGAFEGSPELFICNAHTLSSLSLDWIQAVRESGRFSSYSWPEKRIIPLTTLDKLIYQYGLASFIKIGVESFELEVLKGLSFPVPKVCFEFTPEFMEPTLKYIEHLQSIGDIRVNYSIGETACLVLERWVSPFEMIDIFKGFKCDNELFADIYVQFPSALK